MALPSQMTAPIEPVSLAYAKTFLRIDHDHEDELIGDLITIARIRVETMTRHILISREIDHCVPGDSTQSVKLSAAPIGSIISVKVTDQNGSELTLSEDQYRVTRRGEFLTIDPVHPSGWAGFTARIDEVVVTYLAGYGESGNDVPHPFRQAILLLLAQSYELRGDVGDAPVPMMVDAVLMPYRKFWL